MATVYQQLHPEGATYLATAFPAFVKINGTNYPVSGLAFDASTTEAAFWHFRAVAYGSGNLTVDIEWYADTATATDEVRWDVQIAALTPNTDDVDIETDALATVNSVTDTQIAGVDQRLHRAVVTVSNLDSLAADDFVTMRLARDHDHADDDLTGDAIATLVTVSYSDS